MVGWMVMRLEWIGPSKCMIPNSMEKMQAKSNQALISSSLVMASEKMDQQRRSLWWLIIGIGILFRLVLAMYQPHSGKSSPPMFGDFEAQRHWIELSKHLPISEWYFYDLEYWGLDYPPLTAFHHYLMGKLSDASGICPGCFDFEKSRGNQSFETIMFMRISVLIADLILYIPICYLILNSMHRLVGNGKQFMLECVALMCWPSLILIDHGHFQYNTIFLALTLLSIYCLMKFQNQEQVIYLIIACISFVSSIMYKQMALYYSLPIFFYILGITLRKPKQFIVVAITVILTFVCIFLPFAIQKDGISVILQVVHRMFPFKRGLYEDKVSSFWCSTSILIKWNQYFDDKTLIRMSTLFTLLCLIPSCLHLFYKAIKLDCLKVARVKKYLMEIFLINLVIASFSFYLFSFQVHEKTILLPLLPSLLVFCMHIEPVAQFVPLLSLVSNFSMFPLFIKDDLKMAYFFSQIIYILINLKHFNRQSNLVKFFTALSIMGMTAIHYFLAFSTPPSRYPDLFTLMCTTFSFVHFFTFLIICYYTQLWHLDSPEKTD